MTLRESRGQFPLPCHYPRCLPCETGKLTNHSSSCQSVNTLSLYTVSRYLYPVFLSLSPDFFSLPLTAPWLYTHSSLSCFALTASCSCTFLPCSCTDEWWTTTILCNSLLTSFPPPGMVKVPGVTVGVGMGMAGGDMNRGGLLLASQGLGLASPQGQGLAPGTRKD